MVFGGRRPWTRRGRLKREMDQERNKLTGQILLEQAQINRFKSKLPATLDEIKREIKSRIDEQNLARTKKGQSRLTRAGEVEIVRKMLGQKEIQALLQRTATAPENKGVTAREALERLRQPKKQARTTPSKLRKLLSQARIAQTQIKKLQEELKTARDSLAIKSEIRKHKAVVIQIRNALIGAHTNAKGSAKENLSKIIDEMNRWEKAWKKE